MGVEVVGEVSEEIVTAWRRTGAFQDLALEARAPEKQVFGPYLVWKTSNSQHLSRLISLSVCLCQHVSREAAREANPMFWRELVPRQGLVVSRNL